ncbi:SDR family NAD(P)-dependent oxidoreductase [Noviherbaspirillum galbum]|uniref:SDR family NAD(P)-dependent oxidoreductase n=1 Tax=Noviherbaspirillum galbum TaxID=2709383 RepID=A0A6B3SN56_9BURK|nr:SDR family NAD(P)-dependent oxidoreductase [Noviherbaspirillum galbum]NEX62117.1 SDR family NAD(P)-dependent oxidoreductase [Noviherbaspirillum galbum]
MQSLPTNYRALVIGSSGAIGSAMVAHLRADPRCGELVGLGRSSTPRLDLEDESTIAAAAAALRASGPWHLVVVATGMLHGPGQMPEKRLAQLRCDDMLRSFAINAVGPAAVLTHFTPLLAREERSLFAVLSAKVGSIGDNRLGGWYSYRAAKAALNMIVKTASIELARTHPRTVLAALHPGTVDSRLSAPFHAAHGKRPASQAAADLLAVLDKLDPAESGSFHAYDGERLPW